MYHTNRPAVCKTAHLAKRLAQTFSGQRLLHAARVVGPTFIALAFASVAHAQGTMDFTGATTLMTTFNQRFAYVSVSRAAQDAQIFTDNASSLAASLGHAVKKASAIEIASGMGI